MEISSKKEGKKKERKKKRKKRKKGKGKKWGKKRKVDPEPGQIGAYSNLYWRELKDYVITESELWATVISVPIYRSAAIRQNHGPIHFNRGTLLTLRAARVPTITQIG